MHMHPEDNTFRKRAFVGSTTRSLSTVVRRYVPLYFYNDKGAFPVGLLLSFLLLLMIMGIQMAKTNHLLK